ncbi:MAG: DUF465 domain-containing protein [Gammaproteobacteria bacterium]|nr:DUF465 domain-containing protein [Gammaproteobacteria bacterium]
MFGEHHDNLVKEFPEYKDKIHQLKANNAHFNKLYHEYQHLDREIWGFEEGEETPSDDYVEQQKKKRAVLKDQLYAMLKA